MNELTGPIRIHVVLVAAELSVAVHYYRGALKNIQDRPMIDWRAELPWEQIHTVKQRASVHSRKFTAGKKNLVCVAADSSDAGHPEVERIKFILSTDALRESGFLKIRDDEAAKTAIDVEANLVFGCQLPQSFNIVLIPVGEVDRGANKLQSGKFQDRASEKNAYHYRIRISEP